MSMFDPKEHAAVHRVFTQAILVEPARDTTVLNNLGVPSLWSSQRWISLPWCTSRANLQSSYGVATSLETPARVDDGSSC